MTLRVLVTRSGAEAEALVAMLEARGFQAQIEPLFTIAPLPVPAAELDAALDGVQALLFTSANGVRAFCTLRHERSWPVFAVGDATAAAARKAGFGSVESAAGNVEDLARLVESRCQPAGGALFHGAATQVAGDLKGELEAAGFTVRRSQLYAAEPAESLSGPTEQALRGGLIEAVLFFSPRTGATFVRLLMDAGLGRAAAGCHAVCLSAAVAAEIRPLDWAGVHIAARPEQAELLATLDKLRPGPSVRPTADARIKKTHGETTASSMTDESATNAPAPSASGESDTPPALQVIAAFGGIRPMANKLGVAVSTVQGWRERGVIPASRHDKVMAAAQSHGIALETALLDASHQARGETKRSSSAAAAEAKSTEVETTETKPMATKPTDDKPTDDKPTEEKSSGDKPAQAEAAAAGASGSKSATPAAAASTSGGAKASTKSEPKAASSAATAATQSQSGQSSFPPKATPAPPPAPPHRHGGWAGPFVAGALVVVLAVVVTVATRHQWQPMFGDSGSDTGTQQAMAALEQKVSSFESALGDLKSQVEAGAGEAASKVASKVEALEQKADGLASRIGKLEAKPEGPEPATAAAVEALAKKQDALATQVDKLESLGKEQDALSARVAKLEAGPEVPPASAADLSAVSAETKSLAQKLAESDSHIAALGESASKLQASLDQMAADQAKAKAAMKREAGLALSLAQLRDALRFSGPFNTELKQVQGVVGDDAELSGLLKPLEGHAADGVPTVDRLRRDFEDAARHIVAAGQGDESDSLLDGVLRRVSNIVTVRRVGEVEGNDTGAVVARAEAKLAEGDLARAVAELDALKGHAAKAAASWRTEADARLAADRAVNALSARTIANVTPTGG